MTNPIRLSPKYIVRYGDTTLDGQQFKEGCFWFNQQQQAEGVPVTIEFNSDQTIGRGFLTANERGVLRTIELSDVDAYVDKVDNDEFFVGWKPVIVIDETQWDDDIEWITSARIFEITLVPRPLTLSRKEMRLLTA